MNAKEMIKILETLPPEMELQVSGCYGSLGWIEEEFIIADDWVDGKKIQIAIFETDLCSG